MTPKPRKEGDLPSPHEALQSFFTLPEHPGADATATQLEAYRTQVAEVKTRNALLQAYPEAAAPILADLNS